MPNTHSRKVLQLQSDECACNACNTCAEHV